MNRDNNANPDWKAADETKEFGDELTPEEEKDFELMLSADIGPIPMLEDGEVVWFYPTL